MRYSYSLMDDLYGRPLAVKFAQICSFSIHGEDQKVNDRVPMSYSCLRLSGAENEIFVATA